MRQLHEEQKTVYCTVQWEAIHHWPDAPEEVDFLREPHRHEFEATVHVEVGHDDRDVEFILLKRLVNYIVGKRLSGYQQETSCEEMCHIIAASLHRRNYPVSKVEVSEDGENGATVTYTRKNKTAPSGEGTADAIGIPLDRETLCEGLTQGERSRTDR